VKSLTVALALAVVGAASSSAFAQPSEAQGGVTVTPAGPTPGPAPAATYRRPPGPRLMAPLRIDIGGIGANSKYGWISGLEVSVGIHWASLSPVPTTFDIGVGVLAGVMSNASVPSNVGDVNYQGVYGEFGKTLSRGDFWRTWALVRGEYINANAFDNTRKTIGLSGKLEAELYIHGVGVSPDGLFLGTYALGVYLEAAARRLDNDVSILQIGAGITIRTPLVWRFI
jgi:hypothetical protein